MKGKEKGVPSLFISSSNDLLSRNLKFGLLSKHRVQISSYSLKNSINEFTRPGPLIKEKEYHFELFLYFFVDFVIDGLDVVFE